MNPPFVAKVRSFKFRQLKRIILIIRSVYPKIPKFKI